MTWVAIVGDAIKTDAVSVARKHSCSSLDLSQLKLLPECKSPRQSGIPVLWTSCTSMANICAIHQEQHILRLIPPRLCFADMKVSAPSSSYVSCWRTGGSPNVLFSNPHNAKKACCLGKRTFLLKYPAHDQHMQRSYFEILSFLVIVQWACFHCYESCYCSETAGTICPRSSYAYIASSKACKYSITSC